MKDSKKIVIKKANTEQPRISMFGYVLTLRYEKFQLLLEYAEELKQDAVWNQQQAR